MIAARLHRNSARKQKIMAKEVIIQKKRYSTGTEAYQLYIKNAMRPKRLLQ